MNIIQLKSKTEIEKRGYLTFDSAAKHLSIGTRQLYRYRKGGLIPWTYGKLWKAKAFPIISQDDLDILKVVRKTSRRHLINIVQTTNDSKLKKRLECWLNPFARTKTSASNKQR